MSGPAQSFFPQSWLESRLRPAQDASIQKALRRLAHFALPALVALTACAPPPPAVRPPDFDPGKPRLIVLTDHGGDPDDLQSMVRLLTYANELEIEGLVATTSRHLPGEVHPDLIEERIRAYGEVLANLRVHDPRYPDAGRLLEVVRAGSPVYGMAGVGNGLATPGSRQIIEVVDRPDPRPVWVTIWGGASTLAQALWDVRATRSRAELERFVSKLRVYSISDQDDAGPWARAEFPRLFWIASVHGPTQYELATWHGISADVPGADPAPVSRRWLNQHVRSHGPLGRAYPRPAFIMEGDTPSFLYLIPNGLGRPEHPDWGSWGGRYGRLAPFLGLWSDVQDSVPGVDGRPYTNNKTTVWRWRQAFQNDFAARMDWSVTPDFDAANHPPEPVLNGVPGPGPVTLTACPGESVTLHAEGSGDPDGDALDHRWWWYREVAGIYSPNLEIDRDEGPETTVVAPAWRQPYEIPLPEAYGLHAILETRDDGSPPLTRYRRAIIRVPTNGARSDSGETCATITVDERAPGLAQIRSDAATASSAYYNTADSTLGTLLDLPVARAILERHIPSLIEQASSDARARMLTLRMIQRFNPSDMRDELLDAIDAELAELAPPPEDDSP